MKRYRTVKMDFDSRVNILKLEIKDEWEESVKKIHRENKESIQKELRQEFGNIHHEEKEKNFIDMGPYFPSIISFHNKFFNQIRLSFTMGGFYPAFTGVTTLTERVLNHLIISLRNDFKKTKEYKEVHDKDSFDDWDFLIRVLGAWNVLLPETKPYLIKLKKLRHQYAVHFNPDTDKKDREFALESINAFQEFIKIQFGFLGKQPWFIPKTKGAFFIKKEYETNPFIRKIYLPNCVLVGPKYKFVNTSKGLKVQDKQYENREISDNEFRRLLENERGATKS